MRIGVNSLKSENKKSPTLRLPTDLGIPWLPSEQEQSKSVVELVVKGITEAIALSVSALILAYALGYFHFAYKEAALAIAVWNFPYATKEGARSYLQNLARDAKWDVTDKPKLVETFIAWVHKNMQLQNKWLNHPNPVFLIERGGLCGQFASVLAQLLQANGLEARQVLLNWNGESTAHVIVEVKIDGRWTAFDPLGFGGGAFPGNVFISHISKDEVGLSTLDLYKHPEVLPVQNGFGPTFFTQGAAFKVEVKSAYSDFNVSSKFIYGRDWPLVKITGVKRGEWVYDENVSSRLQEVVVWHQFPYFSRVTLWFGAYPIVLHFEWGLVGLALLAYLLYRFREKLRRVWLLRTAIYLSLLCTAYVATLIYLWWQRFSL